MDSAFRFYSPQAGPDKPPVEPETGVDDGIQKPPGARRGQSTRQVQPIALEQVDIGHFAEALNRMVLGSQRRTASRGIPGSLQKRAPLPLDQAETPGADLQAEGRRQDQPE